MYSNNICNHQHKTSDQYQVSVPAQALTYHIFIRIQQITKRKPEIPNSYTSENTTEQYIRRNTPPFQIYNKSSDDQKQICKKLPETKYNCCFYEKIHNYKTHEYKRKKPKMSVIFTHQNLMKNNISKTHVLISAVFRD